MSDGHGANLKRLRVVQQANAARSDLYRLIEPHLAKVDLLVTPTLAVTSLPAYTDPHA